MASKSSEAARDRERLEVAAKDDRPRVGLPSEGDGFSQEIARQARALDADIARLAGKYARQYVAYYGGEVLGHGRTAGAAVAGLSEDQRRLAFVVRYVDPRGSATTWAAPRRTE
jgi:hypothetical protein